MNTLPPLPAPDTHVFDDDTQKDCWSHSPSQMSEYALEAIAAQAKQAAVQAPPGWQPIGTAPKDAAAVLVMRDIWPGTGSGRAEDCNEHNTYVAAWWEGESTKGAWICYMDAVEDPLCPIDPTHWMPLPPPPNAKQPVQPTPLTSAQVREIALKDPWFFVNVPVAKLLSLVCLIEIAHGIGSPGAPGSTPKEES